MEQKDGGPAFPIADPFAAHQPGNVDEAKRLAEGMTLRDYFAAKAMQAAATNTRGAEGFTIKQRAEWAYEQADAMIRARQGASNG